jgi:hypothetical protein
MRPVNISFNQDVVTKQLDPPLHQIGGSESATLQQRHTTLSQDTRRDVQPDEINQAFVPGCSLHGRASFQQQRTDAQRAEALQSCLEAPVRRSDDSGPLFFKAGA